MGSPCDPSIDETDNQKQEKEENENSQSQNGQPGVEIRAEKPLQNITRHRVKGPAGRRAPRNRQTVQFGGRASSLSTLPVPVNGETRLSFSSLGGRVSVSPSDQISLGSDAVRMEPFEEAEESKYHFEFSDIDRVLFFGSSTALPEEPEVQTHPSSDINPTPIPPTTATSPEETKKKKKLSSLSFIRKSFGRKRKLEITKVEDLCDNNNTNQEKDGAPNVKSSSRCVIS